MNKHLSRSKNRKGVIRIRTKAPDGMNIDGIVLQEARSFVSLLVVEDFEPDGIVVVPKKWIKGIRDGKFEACATEMIRFSGTLERTEPFAWPSNLTSLAEVCAYLKERDIWPAVEIIYNGDDSAFYIGPITEISKRSLRLYCYDAAGQWEKEYEIDFAEIFRIEFESRYARNFNAFMKTRPKPNPV